MTVRTGTTVSWAWGAHRAEGKVVEVFHEKVTRTLAGSETTRNGSDDDPAYVIVQDDGTVVLKLRSEVTKA